MPVILVDSIQLLKVDKSQKKAINSKKEKNRKVVHEYLENITKDRISRHALHKVSLPIRNYVSIFYFDANSLPSALKLSNQQLL